MIPRLNISFPLRRQWQFCFGRPYEPAPGEFLLDHARSGIVLALQAAGMQGKRVGVVAYNCHTVANAVVSAGCKPVFLDVCENLTINLSQSALCNCDAIIVTNLFGIRNDIAALRAAAPDAILIVDNAHGFGLPAEGDYTVYSINQGKFPALGPGGILVCNAQVPALSLPAPSLLKGVKVFCSMLLRALLYSPLCYWLIRRRKAGRVVPADHSPVRPASMPLGVSRLYAAALPEVPSLIAQQRANAEAIIQAVKDLPGVCHAFLGDNAFMLVLYCEDPAPVKQWFLDRGVETETHFRGAIRWAREFGYVDGSCPVAESLTQHLLMVPTYKMFLK